MAIWDKLRGAFSTGKGAAAAPPKAVEPKPITPEEHFAAQVEAAFRARPGVTSVERKPGEFAFLVTRNGLVSTAYLHNIFHDWRDATPDARAAGIQRFANSLPGPETKREEWQDARAWIVPVLRGAAMFAGAPGEGRPLQRPFAPFLIAAIAIDGKDSMRYAGESDLTAWNIVIDIAFSTASENASHYFQDSDVESYDSQAPYPIWHVAKDDSYESSRLFVPGWLARFEGKVRGRPIAIVPHRSLLIVGGDGDANCLQRLLLAARSEYKASARRISPMLYTINESKIVVPYTLPAGHPLANEIALSQALLADFEYGQQKARLDQQLGEKVFIASFTAMKMPDGRVSSRAVWSKGVPTLLPKTDLVALNPAEPNQPGEPFVVRWDDLMRIVGASLEPVAGLNPPRWGTGPWPDQKALAELRVLAML